MNEGRTPGLPPYRPLKTVGALIDALSKYPREEPALMKFARGTRAIAGISEEELFVEIGDETTSAGRSVLIVARAFEGVRRVRRNGREELIRKIYDVD